MQVEATLLKSVISGGAATKIIALGVGDEISDSELQDIASPPYDRNVIHVNDFHSLSDVEDDVRDNVCRGKHFPMVS